MTIAISTGGRSPAMSKYIRLKLDAALGPDVEKMVELQENVREQIKKSVKGQKRREEILWGILDDPAVWKALEKSPVRALELAMRHARQ